MWFIAALITTLAWGTADLFYKKGNAYDETNSHLKTVIMVGLVMGAHAVFQLLTLDFVFDYFNIIRYLPVTLSYILSMAIGYYGLRYLELSISSPIQNSSGAFSALLMFIFMGQTMSTWQLVAVVMITVGIVLIGRIENEEARGEEIAKEGRLDKKYRGAIALIFPILYCVIDSLGTFLDSYYYENVFVALPQILAAPNEAVAESMIEATANIAYELTFLIAGLLVWIYLVQVKKDNLVWKNQGNRTLAAIFETAGQFTYNMALSGSQIIVAPLIGSYAFVSVLWGRIFLEEKLTSKHYAAIAMVLVGILVLAIIEG